MYSTKNNRRHFLKLASGLMAAPLGLSSSFAQEADSQSPMRFLTIIDHFGVPPSTRTDSWISSTAGDYELTDDHLGSILRPFQNYKENMLIVSGLSLQSAIQTSSVRTHHAFLPHTLGGSKALNERTAAASIPHETVDVTIGNYLNSTRQRIHPHAFFTDYAERGNPTYCYDTTGTLIRSYAGANSAVDNLLTGLDTASDPLLAAQLLARQDILNKISSRVQLLKSEYTSASYTEKLEAYEASVNDLSAQLELTGNSSCILPDEFNSLSTGGRNNSAVGRGDILKVIGQLFSCDMVSSATYAFGGELMNQNSHGFVDSRGEAAIATQLNKNMHASSHRGDDIGDKCHEYIRIHQSELIAELLETLSTTVDIDGNMLIDNTVIYLPSCMAHNTHQRNDYATAIIAGSNTNLRGGFHYDCSDSTNNDLLVTLAQGVNVPLTDHGGYRNNTTRVDSLNNGPISKLLKTTLT